MPYLQVCTVHDVANRLTAQAMCGGIFIISVISVFQERIAKRFMVIPKSAESRLYYSCVQSICKFPYMQT